MIIINLGNDQFPWKEWITLIKTSPATRRIPILGFGSHVAAEQFDSALDSGADAVFPRSHFFSHLSKILLEYARTIDMDQILASCQEPLSQKAIAGLDLFNKGEFFEAHEFLELAWKDDRSNGRDLYRAILQVAVAYLQIVRGNYRGSIKMFLRVRQWINPLPEICRGVDIGQLRLDAEIVYQQLVKLGANHIDEFDRSLFHPIIYDVSR